MTETITGLTWKRSDRCSEPDRSWTAEVRIDETRTVTVECWFIDGPTHRRWRLRWPDVVDHVLNVKLDDERPFRSLDRGLELFCIIIDSMAQNARKAVDAYDIALRALRAPTTVSNDTTK